MTPFDPLRAQREILISLADACDVIAARVQAAEKRMAEDETEYNALVKISRLVVGLVDEARAKLRRLEAEAEAQGKMGSPP